MDYKAQDRWKWFVVSVVICVGIILAVQLGIDIVSRFKRPPIRTYEDRVDDFVQGKTKKIIMDAPDDVMNHHKWEEVTPKE